MSFVVIDNLKKYFGNVLASNIEHLEVHQGEFVSFLGPSGCGKTTTLRCIAGIIEPDAGLISIRGRDITRTPPYKRNLGMVFQNYALFPHMTVFDNVAYGLRNYRKLAKKEIGDKVAQVLELVELPGFEGRFPHQLSGGQQQRIALARAVVYDPDVLLLDEPLSNLDAKLRKSMRFELKRLQRRLNITTIFVTHDQQEALSLSDSIVVMNGGRVEQVGSPLEIYENPSTLFVADFIGSTNLLKGIVCSFDPKGMRCRVSLSSGVEVEASTPVEIAVNATASLIIKPEKVQIARESEGRNVISGEVLNVAYVGSGYSYHVQIGDSHVIEAIDTAGDFTRNQDLRIGERVNLHIDPNWLRVVRE
ncbi:MAG: ABC transporter ATP-binding protein [Dehalococcoidales bacterium]|nr:ABC transporter ATP-binding protein [Dehalococcoidales bacterium]